ncbi:hypothetical protein [Thermomonas carbonis]|uniref:Uncharacterized protein n=2 Tax=Thermomonas carbonis TaxID=1463158 RepID=A0A7G9SNH5_9GAMM|nr:hypothetical protein [Thermomonas carbonis]QNN69400.1 hypothetical protein H9L16_12045 [Thermomonas carbonis]
MHFEDEHSYRLELFERKVRKADGGACWEWLGAKSGTFGLGGLGGIRSALVAAWILYRDPDYDPDLPNTFMRLCGRSDCVNPEHAAIMGPFGLANPKDVVLYISSRHPPARTALQRAAEALPDFGDG